MSFAMEPVMSWLLPFWAGPAGREPATHAKPPVRVDAVRSVMLGHASLVPEACGLRARILRADDAQGLWYLRPPDGQPNCPTCGHSNCSTWPG